MCQYFKSPAENNVSLVPVGHLHIGCMFAHGPIRKKLTQLSRGGNLARLSGCDSLRSNERDKAKTCSGFSGSRNLLLRSIHKIIQQTLFIKQVQLLIYSRRCEPQFPDTSAWPLRLHRAPGGTIWEPLRSQGFLFPHFLEPMLSKCIIHFKTLRGGQRITEKIQTHTHRGTSFQKF